MEITKLKPTKTALPVLKKVATYARVSCNHCQFRYEGDDFHGKEATGYHPVGL